MGGDNAGADSRRSSNESVTVDTTENNALVAFMVTWPPSALRKMKVAGVRLLLVPDVEDNIIGIITATDILGDLPLRKGQELEMPHHDLHVDMIMTPLEEMLAVDMVTVRDARVGHIISTLRNHERQHMLVVEIDRMTQQHMIRGLFSTSQISKLVSHDITDPEYAAHTLADVYHELG